MAGEFPLGSGYVDLVARDKGATKALSDVQRGLDGVARSAAAAEVSTRRSVDGITKEMDKASAAAAGSAGRTFVNGFSTAIAVGFAAAGIGRLIEGAVNAAKTGESIGRSITAGIVDALRDVPIAGAIGDMIPRIADRLSGGDGLTFEERSQVLDVERARRMKLAHAEADLVGGLGEDQLTPAQLRRKQFGEKIRPILQGIGDPAEANTARNRMLGAFADRESRDAARAAEKQAKEADDAAEEMSRLFSDVLGAEAKETARAVAELSRELENLFDAASGGASGSRAELGQAVRAAEDVRSDQLRRRAEEAATFGAMGARRDVLALRAQGRNQEADALERRQRFDAQRATATPDQRSILDEQERLEAAIAARSSAPTGGRTVGLLDGLRGVQEKVFGQSGGSPEMQTAQNTGKTADAAKKAAEEQAKANAHLKTIADAVTKGIPTTLG